MKDEEMKLGSRLVLGAVAGFVATLAMTSTMRRLHKQLPAGERYPLTPREIVDSTAAKADLPLSNEAAKDITLATHFLYGAGCGSLIAAADPRIGRASGAAAGVAVWLVSYMGWIPGVSILKPASDHPAKRNAVMIAAHLVWGATTATALRELTLARETVFAGGPDRDAPSEGRQPPL